MKCFIWTDEASYTAFAHCENVTEARRMLRDEIGGYDGSCPERKKAREAVEEMTPAIYVGRIAGFRLSDSAEVRELEQYQDKLTAERDALRAELAAAKEEASRLRGGVISAMVDFQHGLPGNATAKLTLLLDGILKDPKNNYEALAAKLAAAVERAEKAEADRNAATRRAIEAELLCEKLRLEKSEFRDKRDGARARAEAAEAEAAHYKAAAFELHKQIKRMEADSIAQYQKIEAERDALRAEAAQLRGNVAAANLTADLSSGREFDAVMEYDALARQNAALRAALEVFGNGSVIEAIEREDFSVMKERIVDWFGPSDFKKAKSALALTPPAGGEAGKDSARLDHLIDRKLLSCDVFEDAAEMCIKAGCEDPDNDRRWVRAAIDRSEEEGRC